MLNSRFFLTPICTVLMRNERNVGIGATTSINTNEVAFSVSGFTGASDRINIHY
jgi:hypothetical protein